jgi:hypothetical protein
MTAKFFRNKMKQLMVIGFSILMIGTMCAGQTVYSAKYQEGVNPNPPDHVVKLIFIHHSCGENLLNDDNGALGLALSSNNYFVSDTYYGWGPDGIGDRTDILDWPEWFSGPNSATYMNALFNENEQSTWYSRQVADPGGENEIVLFKSCFPNSDMGGRPDDTAKSGRSLTVASAKQIYIDLLDTFAQHPDKLFVVLTAPPMQDISRPENARAFNTWLVQDWLDEANYPYNNVAVWDFYNVLSGANNHHRVMDGAIQYITDQGGNTLYYPDNGDDHPSQQGNLKAVEEFVPMLNVFYNRWQQTVPQNVQQAEEPATEDVQDEVEEEQSEIVEQENSALSATGTVEDFGGGSLEWNCYADKGVNTEIQCEVAARSDNANNMAFHIQFNTASQSWATAVTFFDEPISIAGTGGLSLEMMNPQGNPINLIVYKGDDENRETYLFPLAPGYFTDWQEISIPWENFKRAEWEGGNQEIMADDAISGFGFGFDGLDSDANTGELWVDSITWLSEDGSLAPATAGLDSPGSEDDRQSQNDGESENNNSGNGFLACPGAAALLFAVFSFALLQAKTRLM